MNERKALESELKELIIDILVLEDLTPEDIASDQPLFGNGLGLDSIDALEIAAALEQRYGVTVADDAERNRKRFASIANLADFVSTARRK